MNANELNHLDVVRVLEYKTLPELEGKLFYVYCSITETETWLCFHTLPRNPDPKVLTLNLAGLRIPTIYLEHNQDSKVDKDLKWEKVTLTADTPAYIPTPKFKTGDVVRILQGRSTPKTDSDTYYEWHERMNKDVGSEREIIGPYGYGIKNTYSLKGGMGFYFHESWLEKVEEKVPVEVALTPDEKDRTIYELEGEIQHLKKTNTSLKAEVAQLDRRREAILADFDNHEAHAKKEIDQLKRKNEDLQKNTDERYESWRGKIKEKEQEISRLSEVIGYKVDSERQRGEVHKLLMLEIEKEKLRTELWKDTAETFLRWTKNPNAGFEKLEARCTESQMRHMAEIISLLHAGQEKQEDEA